MSDNKYSYIGDGVYVTDDGYHLWLAANTHLNHVIALDPSVCIALIGEMKRVLPAEQLARLLRAEAAKLLAGKGGEERGNAFFG